ncbi:MAG TPA: nucleoside hydrolase [Treponemataceae bacterium]|nr:nucleoside hydrolase [Treponemataceae bacterium]
MTPRRIILDVDTGHDDAVAIMMAGRDPALRLEAITVTAGNQTLPKTLRNTLNMCSALGIDAPVYAGMTRPLVRELVPASRIHGESGLDGPRFDSCDRVAENGHAAAFIARKIMECEPGEITLVAVGPLSNVAMAIRLEPAICSRVREIVLMGGSMGAGNVTPSAEFNIHADPEAASIVFGSGARLTMMGLDVTRNVTLTPDLLERFAAFPGRAAGIFAASMRSYAAACEKYIGERPAMHDPCCVAYVSDPSLFTLRDYRVDIELSGEYSVGRTVVDFHGATLLKPNVSVAQSVDEPRFWRMLEADLLRYGDLSRNQ